MERTRFEEILLATKRNGIENVLKELAKTDFFISPASTRFHLACEGGLLTHSLNVYDAAMMIRGQLVQRKPEIEALLPNDSIAIATLLHDTCKSDIYQKAILSRKTADGYWEKYPGYSVNYTAGLPLGHGEKSVIMLLLRACESIENAHRYHNALNAQKKKAPWA